MRHAGLLTLLLGACASAPVAPMVPAAAPGADLVQEGDLLRRHGRASEAEAAYRAALERDPRSVRAHLGLQELELDRGLSLKLRRVYREHGDGFLEGRLEAAPARQQEAFSRAEEPWKSLGFGMWEAADGSLGSARRSYRRACDLDPGLALARVGHAQTLLLAGRLGEAQAEYEAARWLDPQHPAPELGLSLVHDRRGDLAAAFRHAVEAYRRAPAEEALAVRVHELAMRRGRRALPEARRVLEREGEAGQGIAFLRASRIAAASGEPERARVLLARARALGLTRAEAEAVPASPPPAVRRFVRTFVRAVVARYRHYAATGESESFREFQAWARALYEETTGRTLEPPGAPLTYSFVGTLIDPTEWSDEPLVRELREHGLLLVLGQRAGGPPEALLGELVRLEPLAKVPVRGTWVERQVAWIGTRHVSGYQEWGGGGDLAGLALPRLVIVDLHAVARWEGDIERRRARLAPHAQELIGETGLPDLPVTSVGDPAGVADRLYLAGKLDIAREVLKHEEAHLVDADRHLPVMRHPFRNLGLAFKGGFSAAEILAILERNAQLTAIAEGPHPRLALATCCAALGGGGAHANGYAQIVAAFVSGIHKQPERFAEIDTTRVIVQQLHLLPDGKIRELAREVSRDWRVSDE